MLERGFFFVMLASIAVDANAQAVYKIIGPDGRVTYTNEAPARNDSRASRVDVDRGNTVPAPSRPVAPAPTTTTDALQEQLLRERIDTERARRESYEAEAERQRVDTERQRAEVERLAAARAECERQRWTRCDDPDFLVERGWISPLPGRSLRDWPNARSPNDRPGVRPVLPRDQPAPLPPGTIPHQAPADQYSPRAYPPVPPGTPGYPR